MTTPRFVPDMVKFMWLYGILALLGVQTLAAGQSQPSIGKSKRHLPAGFIARTLRLDEKGPEYKYAIFVPPQYKLHPDHAWPVILFLHGSGECGEDGIKQTTVGLPVYASLHAGQFPFIMVMPQAHGMWFRGQESLAAWRAMAETIRDYRVDMDRIYVTGLSMGGYGAWEMAITQPDAFAAIVPVCGAAPKQYVSNVAHVPIWAFHGALDNHVPVSGSREAIAELRRMGAKPKYTEYPALGHECWDQAYSEPELWKWLLSQKRQTPRVIDFRIPNGLARVWWLAVKAMDGLKGPAWIHAELGEHGQVNVQTEGVDSWGLVSDHEPLKPGTEIQVNWNGQVVFRKAFPGALAITPNGVSGQGPSAASQPADGAPTSGKSEEDSP